MNAYIARVTERPLQKTIYDFGKAIETAWFWDEKGEADEVCLALSQWGIITQRSFGGGMSHCSDFRVVPRPQGGFAISCELP
jgi:hypothetical protein